ncbi:MAG: hypothetical protein ACUVWA_14370 [Candidatus Oleimicrobiaceae bacterium]
MQGSRAYILYDGTKGLSIIDISNPLAPVEAGGYESGAEKFSDFFISNSTAFMKKATTPALLAVDVSNPQNPTLLSSIDVGYGLLQFSGFYGNLLFYTKSGFLKSIIQCLPRLL